MKTEDDALSQNLLKARSDGIEADKALHASQNLANDLKATIDT
jgi:hypothetical protein